MVWRKRGAFVEPIVPKREPPIVDGAAGYWQKSRRPLAARACSDRAPRDRDPALWLDRFQLQRAERAVGVDPADPRYVSKWMADRTERSDGRPALQETKREPRRQGPPRRGREHHAWRLYRVQN